MDLMNSIASASMEMSAQKMAQQYSVSLAKKAMDTQDLAVQELLTMLPDQPKIPMGQYLDVYA